LFVLEPLLNALFVKDMALIALQLNHYAFELVQTHGAAIMFSILPLVLFETAHTWLTFNPTALPVNDSHVEPNKPNDHRQSKNHHNI
jgi:hypothetical protein